MPSAPKTPPDGAEELEQLAALIAVKVWQRVRRLILKQQRELHDLYEEE